MRPPGWSLALIELLLVLGLLAVLFTIGYGAGG